jgi:hypothetical protein
MAVFLAGATGVIGTRLLALLHGAGHEVAGMTRSPDKASVIAALGALPVVCDVFDAVALVDAVVGFAPDLLMHQLTDLPDHLDEIPDYVSRNNRIRTEGTRNLLAAAGAAGARRFLAQSITWTPPGSGQAVAEHERLILDSGGVVVRYGQLYGPGTYYPDGLPAPPGSTSRVPPGAPWRYSTRQAGSSSSPTTISEELTHEKKRDGAEPRHPEAHHPLKNHPPRSNDFPPISLSRAVPHAAVGLRRANRATRSAFEIFRRESPAYGPREAKIGCVGQGDHSPIIRSINPVDNPVGTR